MGFASIAGAAIGAVGGLLGNKSSANEAEKSRESTREAMQYKHQWEVKDLKRAGLNPILSANNSGGVPGFATAGQANPFAGAGDTLNSGRKIDEIDKRQIALNQYLADAQVGNLHAQQQNQYAQKDKAFEEIRLLESQKNLTNANTLNAQLTGANIIDQGAAIRAQAIRDMAVASQSSALSEKARSDAALGQREQRAGQYEEKTQKYTRPVRDVLETIPILNLLMKKRY